MATFETLRIDLDGTQYGRTVVVDSEGFAWLDNHYVVQFTGPDAESSALATWAGNVITQDAQRGRPALYTADQLMKLRRAYIRRVARGNLWAAIKKTLGLGR